MAGRLRNNERKSNSLYVKAVGLLFVLAVIVAGLVSMQGPGTLELASPSGNFFVSSSELDAIAPEIASADVVISRFTQANGECVIALPSTYPGQVVSVKINSGQWQTYATTVMNGEIVVRAQCLGSVSMATVAYSMAQGQITKMQYNV